MLFPSVYSESPCCEVVIDGILKAIPANSSLSKPVLIPFLYSLCLTERVPGGERDASKISTIPEKHRRADGHHTQTQRGR